MTQLLEAALAYAAQGWPIFPVSIAKEPLVKGGVLAATTDPATIREWWEKFPRANIALDAGGAGFMVFDFDPGSSKEAFAKSLGGAPPQTGLRARTPRGGEHWYYALGEGETVPPYTASAVKGEPKFSPHVDVRSFHSYVLLPPSRTKDGAYEWESFGKPAHRTDEMYRIARTTRTKSEKRDEWIIEADMPENVASAVEWLKHEAKPAIKGSGGNITAYATAAMCKSYGLSEPTAFEVMWEHWAPRCTPPWYSPETLETVISHAYTYNTSPPGNMTPAYRRAKSKELFKPVVVESGGGREITAGRFRFVDRDGMANIRPPSWLIKDLLPIEAYGMLVGAPGAFKSFVALDIALSVAAAGWAHDLLWDVADGGAVLYCAGEGRSGLANRVRAWEHVHTHGSPAQGFVLSDPVPSVHEDWEPFLEAAWSLAPNGYKLVVIDTVGRSMQGANENSQEHASKLTARIEQVIKTFGCSVLALHHKGHGNHERGKGSMEFIGAPDTIATLDRSDGLSALLRVVKQKDGEEWEKPQLVTLAEISPAPGVKSLVPIRMTEARTVRSEQQKIASSFETQFLLALANAPRAKDGTVLWPDVRAAMAGMNEDQAQNAPKYIKEIQNWFTRDFKRRAEFDTGRRGANNAVILRVPS